MHQSVDAVVQFQHIDIIRHIIFVHVDLEIEQFISGFFQFRRQNIPLSCHIHRKRYKSGRHIDIIEGAGHGILAADGRQSESHLCVISSKERRKRLTPPLRSLTHSAEIFLEGKADLLTVAARRNDLCHGLRHRIDRAVVRTPGGDLRIKAVTHHRHRIGFSGEHRQLCRHHLGFRQLIFSAIGHQHTARADGRVKHLHQSLLGTNIQIRQFRQPGLFQIIRRKGFLHCRNGRFLQLIFLLGRNRHLDGSLLVSAVCIKERSGDIDDLLASPFQDQPGRSRHLRHNDSLQVLFSRIL